MKNDKSEPLLTAIIVWGVATLVSISFVLIAVAATIRAATGAVNAFAAAYGLLGVATGVTAIWCTWYVIRNWNKEL